MTGEDISGLVRTGVAPSAVIVNGDNAAREVGLRALRAAGVSAKGAPDVHGGRMAVALDGARLVLVDRGAGGSSALDLFDELRRAGGGTRTVQVFMALLSVDAQGTGTRSAAPAVPAERRSSGIGYAPDLEAEAGPETGTEAGPEAAVADEGSSLLLSELCLRDARARFERLYLDELLRRHRGNVSEVARRAGLARTFLHAKLAKLDLDPTTYRKRKRKR